MEWLVKILVFDVALLVGDSSHVKRMHVHGVSAGGWLRLSLPLAPA